MIGDKNAAFATSIDEQEFQFLKLDRTIYPNGTGMIQLRRRGSNDERAVIVIPGTAFDALTEFRAITKWLESKVQG